MTGAAWGYAPLGLVAEFIGGGTPTTSQAEYWGEPETGGTPWLSIGDMSRRRYARLPNKALSSLGMTSKNLRPGPPGTVLFAMYASVGEVSNLQFSATWNQAILGILPRSQEELTEKFLYYALTSLKPTLSQWFRSNTQDNLNAGIVRQLRIPLPTVLHQRRIANLLDRETAEIDAMDAELDQLVETLRERKAAAMSAPWNGPQSRIWETRPLWSMFRREKILGCTNEPMVSVFREHGVVFKDDHDNLNVTAQDRSIYQLIETGWLVINRMKAWQGSVGVSAIRGITSGHYICFRPLHREDPRYLNWLFRSPQSKDWFAAHSRGVRPGQAEIDNSYLDGMPIVVPPLSEQRRIVAELDEHTAGIDDMVADATRLKTLLAERRATLITEVVTGAKEVPA